MRTMLLSEDHADAAADLVRERLALLRRHVPAVAESCGSPGKLAERIARLAGRGPGIAVMDGGRLAGFLGAAPIVHGGRQCMFSPEWGHGAASAMEPDAARRVYEILYAEVAGKWAAARAETHIVALLAHDAVAFETFSWFGFGRIVCDAVRSLEAVVCRAGAVSVRRATHADAALVCGFDRRLHVHTQSSPVFLSPDEPEDLAWWEARLSEPRTAIWISEVDGEAVGYLIHGPASDDACDLIVDSGTSSITGAYVAPEARGAGAATALLARAVEWAREQGYMRMAVDFETANVEGARFWLRYFRPVVISWARTIRRIDTRGD